MRSWMLTVLHTGPTYFFRSSRFTGKITHTLLSFYLNELTIGWQAVRNKCICNPVERFLDCIINFNGHWIITIIIINATSASLFTSSTVCGKTGFICRSLMNEELMITHHWGECTKEMNTDRLWRECISICGISQQ